MVQRIKVLASLPADGSKGVFVHSLQSKCGFKTLAEGVRRRWVQRENSELDSRKVRHVNVAAI